MGIGIRIFVVEDDDSIKRFPLTRFKKLIWRDPEVTFSPCANITFHKTKNITFQP